LTGGSIALLDAGENVLGFTRNLAEETLLCVFNFSTAPTTWPLPLEREAVSPLDVGGGGELGEENSISLPGLGFFFARIGERSP
jgi:alpha-glucosidase